MGKRDEALELLQGGLDPVQIAARQGVSFETILGYLDQLVGAGRLRRSDILFSVDAQKRSDAANWDSLSGEIKGGSRSGTSDLWPYVKILEKYGSAACAMGDIYEDIRCVETTLHGRVREALRGRFGDGETGWWRSGLPESLRKKLVGRREEDDSPVDPYGYTDLLDLAEILERNWGQIAADIVPNPTEKQNLLRDLQRLNQVRRKVMHPVRSSAPSEEDFEFIRKVRKLFGV